MKSREHKESAYKCRLLFYPKSHKLFLHIVEPNILIPLSENFYSKVVHGEIKFSGEIKVAREHFLRTLQWHLTERCNLNCMHCYVEAKTSSYSEFTLKEAIKLINEATELGVVSINISGGEPLLLSYIKDLIEYAYDNGIAIEGIFTNGTLVRRDMFKFCEKYEIPFYVSLDGLKFGHEYLRGKDTYEKVIQTIKVLKSLGCRVNINTMLYKHNANEILPMYEELIKLKVDGWRIARPFIFGRWIKHYKDLAISVDDELKVYIKLLDKYVENEKPFNLELGYVLRCVDGKVWLENYEENSLTCWYFANQITIWPNGIVTPCTWLPIPLGNAKRERLEIIWKRAYKFKEIRVSEIKECQYCPMLKICGAGCRARALIYSNSLYGKDTEMCEIIKNPYFKVIYELINERMKVEIIGVPSGI